MMKRILQFLILYGGESSEKDHHQSNRHKDVKSSNKEIRLRCQNLGENDVSTGIWNCWMAELGLFVRK